MYSLESFIHFLDDDMYLFQFLRLRVIEGKERLTEVEMVQLPTFLHLPALKSLHLVHVAFSANDNGIADPFSNCHM